MSIPNTLVDNEEQTAYTNDAPYEEPYQLAARWSRLLAHYIDIAIILIATYPVMSSYGGFSEMMTDDFVFTTEMVIVNTLSGILAYILINGYFIYQYGQTVAKRMMGIYIAQGDDEDKATFVDILFKRELLFKLIYLIPIIGKIIMTIDFIFILREDQRCVHDLVANTRVLKRSTKLRSAL